MEKKPITFKIKAIPILQMMLFLIIPGILSADCGGTADLELNLVFIGDSHTAIWRYPRACVTFLEQSGVFFNVRYKRYGYAGKTAADLTAYVLDGKITLKARSGMSNLAVLLAGTNAYRIEDYLKLAEAVVSRGFSVVVLTTPPRLNPKKKAFGLPHGNWAYNQRVKKTFPPLRPCILQPMQQVDVNSALIDPSKRHERKAEYTNPAYASGASHLNSEGYNLLGRLVAQEILKIWKGPS